MCGIIGYKGIDEYSPSFVFGHARWATETFTKYDNSLDLKFSKKDKFMMKILNLIKKGNYYAQISEEFRLALNQNIQSKQDVAGKVGISLKTLYRIRRKQDYWVNIQTLVSLSNSLGISSSLLVSNISKIKTKNSFPILFRNINFDKSLARVLGHIIGDGGIHINHREKKFRAFYVNNEGSLLRSFREDIEKIFGKNLIYFRQREIRGNEIWLPSTIGFILHELLEYNQQGDKIIPAIIKNCEDENLIASFLQALYDDEGFLYPDKKMVVIAMSKRNLVEDIRQLVLKIGIKANQILIHKSKNRTTMYYFSITSRDNIQKFRAKIGFLHLIKKQKLDRLIESYR